MYSLKQTIILPLDLKEAWDFFSNPVNLGKITPGHMDFRILNEIPSEIYSGLIIQYTLRPLLAVPVRWVTEICHVKEGELFVDVQLTGPYKIWHHQHHFRAAEGGTEITDIVHYKLPYGILGKLLHKLFIRREVEKIFVHREKVLKELFHQTQEFIPNNLHP